MAAKASTRRYNSLGCIILYALLSTGGMDSLSAQPAKNVPKRPASVLKQIAASISNPDFQQVFHHPEKYRLQILYTQIDRDRNNQPHFISYRYHSSADAYFNPASTVKMPLSFLSLEKLHDLEQYGVTKESYMLTDSSYARQQIIHQDSSSQSGRPSIASYIKRIFLVSDNDAYNRLYEFLGQQYINKRLKEKGYTHTRINRRFYPMNEDENRHTNAIRFLSPLTRRLQYRQPPAYNTDSFRYGPVIRIGRAHRDGKDSLIPGPYDFTRGNQTSLEDLTHMLKAVLFPDAVPIRSRFDLSAKDRQFLLQYMSQYPGETNYPKYDTSKFFDSFTKFYFRDKGRRIPPYIRIFNKPGWSYGFLTDISYIVDFKHQIEFMLSCTLYVNEDGVINDNQYDYESVGFPFMTDLGQAIYRYELHRKRDYRPDLSGFRIKYEKRRLKDNRPLIRNIAD